MYTLIKFYFGDDIPSILEFTNLKAAVEQAKYGDDCYYIIFHGPLKKIFEGYSFE